MGDTAATSVAICCRITGVTRYTFHGINFADALNVIGEVDKEEQPSDGSSAEPVESEIRSAQAAFEKAMDVKEALKVSGEADKEEQPSDGSFAEPVESETRSAQAHEQTTTETEKDEVDG